MKEYIAYFPLLNILLAPAVWILNDMRREIKALRDTQIVHGQAIAELKAADAVRHPGQQAQPLSLVHTGGD